MQVMTKQHVGSYPQNPGICFKKGSPVFRNENPAFKRGILFPRRGILLSIRGIMFSLMANPIFKKGNQVHIQEWNILFPKRKSLFHSSRFPNWGIPRFQDSKIPGFQDSSTPRFQDSKTPGLQDSRPLGTQGWPSSDLEGQSCFFMLTKKQYI